MPELPEVETVVRDLDQALSGATLERIAVGDPRVWDATGWAPSRLAGSRLRGVGRRGKYIVYQFEAGVLIQHLRMTGKMLRADSPRLPAAKRGGRQFRAELQFDRAAYVFFDQRRFGTLYAAAAAAPYFDARGLAPELMGADGGEPALARLTAELARRRTPLKSALLDQAVVCGVGNIYADEALHRAGLHPLLPAWRLARGSARILGRALQAVMGEAIAKRGTSMSDYLDVNGNPGVFRRYLNVYRRAGEPCKTCSVATVERIVVAGRSTHFCPRCQPRRRRRAVALGRAGEGCADRRFGA